MKCPICQSRSRNNFKKSILPKLIQCQNCTGHFVYPVKKSNYKESYFIEKSVKPSLASQTFSPILNYFYYLKVKNIKKILKKTKSPTVLDYGCGSGKLVKTLNQSGIKTTGFDPSPGAVKVARDNNLPVFNTLKKTKNGYDLIMFWHSLEHTPDPLNVIKKSKKLLSKKGELLIAIPNADSIEATLTKQKWFHYTYPKHLVHFTPKAIELMLDRADFKIKIIDYFNPEYTLTGLTQSLLNLVLPENILYSTVTHRRFTKKPTEQLIYTFLSLILTAVFSPIILLLFTYQLHYKKTGAIVVLACKS